MPNYDERRYNAESARRTINQIANKPQVTPRDLDHMYKLAMIADTMERQNNNEEMRRGVPGTGRIRYEMEQGGAEMREYREKPGRYNPQDYPRNEYENEEMRRRRDSSGRYMEYENETPSMMEYRRNDGDGRGYSAHYPYYPTSPHMPPYMTQNGQQPERNRQIGFAKSGQNQSRGTGSNASELFEELEQYYDDYKRHKENYEHTKDPAEKEHLKLELQEFAEYFEKLYKKMIQSATLPEEKQVMQQMLQKMQQSR